jgi:FixJ family two-component response regulator
MAKVFIVDDDSRVAKALGRVLRTEGLAVETSASASELLRHLEHNEPACVLLDLHLPDLSGLELQERLRFDPTLPVIFLTGHGTVAASVQAMKQGAMEFLLKPIDMNLLIDAVRRALARSADALNLQRRRAGLWGLFSRLTSREREVAHLVAQGLLNKQIGEQLGISGRTVKIHRGRVMHKLNIRSVPELIRLLDLIAGDQPSEVRRGGPSPEVQARDHHRH